MRHVHIAGFAADEGFVRLHFPIQLSERFILQGQSDAMHHKHADF